MTVTKVMPGNVCMAGVEVFTEVEGDGQLNIYDALQTSLTPFAGDGVTTRTLGFRVEFFLRCKITSFNPQFHSLRQGYPPRYDFGTVRWLYGSSAQPLEYIDTVLWMSGSRRSLIVVPGVDPQQGFEEEPVGSLDTFDFVGSQISNYPLGNPIVDVGMPATEFAWYIRPETVLIWNVPFVAIPYNQSIIPGDPEPTLYWYLG